MNKRFAAVLAAMAVAGVTSAFAANPFSDVTPSDWAYQSVSQLAQAGVINGYPDGTFKGQNNITRYEMAQMVAKAMANEARANAEQRAVINRLADEFSSELNTLGVRVSALENKVGNVKLTGDARLRFNKTASLNDTPSKSKFSYRARFNMAATVNESTMVNARLVTQNHAGSSSMVEFGDAQSNNIAFDRANVVHKFGHNLSLTAGRYGETLGTGLLYDDAFDGAKLAYNGKLNVAVSHGFLTNFGGLNTDDNATVTLVQVTGEVAKNVKLGGYYVWGNKDVEDELDSVYGFTANARISDKVWLGGEYAKVRYNTDVKGDQSWVAGVGFGKYEMAKKGTWDVKVQYFKIGENALAVSSTYAYPYTSKPAKGWLATVDYALAKNVGLTGYYAFNNKTNPVQGESVKKADYYRVDLNYKF